MSKEKEKQESFLKNYLVDTAAGSVSGAGAAVVTHPLDTQTVRAQAGSNSGSVKVDFKDKIKKLVGMSTSKEKEIPTFKFKHFKTPEGRQKLKKVMDNNYSGLSPRLKKTMIAGAIGYPLFTGSQRVIENTLDGKEKTAGLGSMAMKAVKFFGKKKNPFGRGMIGGSFPKGPGTTGDKAKYVMGMGSTGVAASALPKAPLKSTIEKSVKDIPDLELAGSPTSAKPSRSNGI